MEENSLDQLRQKVANNRGLRKIRAESELVGALSLSNQAEALEIARTSTKHARELLRKTEERQAQSSKYKAGLAWSLRALAFVVKSTLAYPEAEAAIGEAIDIFRELGDHRELLQSLYVRHLILRDQRRSDEAGATLDEAIEIAHITNEHSLDGKLYGARGAHQSALGHSTEAIESFELGLQIARSVSDLQTVQIILVDFANMYEHNGNPQKAAEKFSESLELHRRHKTLSKKNLVGQIWKLYRNLSVREQQNHKTDKLLEEAISGALDAGLPLIAGYFLGVQCQNKKMTADFEGATKAALQGLKLYAAGNHTTGLAMHYSLLATILQILEIPKLSQMFWQRVSSLYASIAPDKLDRSGELSKGVTFTAAYNPDGLDTTKFIPHFEKQTMQVAGHSSIRTIIQQMCLANVLNAAGFYDLARQHYSASIEIGRKFGYTKILKDLLLSLARLELKQKNFEKVDSILEELSQLAIPSIAHTHKLQIMELRVELANAQGNPISPQDEKSLNELRATLQNQETRTRVMLLIEQFLRREAENQSTLLHEELQQAHQAYSQQERALAARDAQIRHLTQGLEKLAVALKNSRDTEGAGNSQLEEMLQIAESATDQEAWSIFQAESSEQDEKFLRLLIEQYPKLTPSERKICSLIRLNNSTRDLCRLLNISTRSVQVYRYRIRKKLGIASSVDLSAFILAL